MKFKPGDLVNIKTGWIDMFTPSSGGRFVKGHRLVPSNYTFGVILEVKERSFAYSDEKCKILHVAYSVLVNGEVVIMFEDSMHAGFEDA